MITKIGSIKVLVLDKDPVEQNILVKRLSKKNIFAKGAESTESLLCDLKSFNPDVIILDIKAYHNEWVEKVREIRDSCPGSGLIILTELVSVENVRVAAAAGAYDYLIKPCPVEEIIFVINNATGTN